MKKEAESASHLVLMTGRAGEMEDDPKGGRGPGGAGCFFLLFALLAKEGERPLLLGPEEKVAGRECENGTGSFRYRRRRTGAGYGAEKRKGKFLAMRLH